MKIAAVAEVGEDATLVHDAPNPDATTAFAISRLTAADYLHQATIGILRQVARPSHDDQARAQITTAQYAAPSEPSDRLAALIGGGDTWTVT